MTGLIWTMQVLKYPLLAPVSASDVPRYEQPHNRRITWLVGPAVAATAVTAVILLGWWPRCPAGRSGDGRGAGGHHC